MANQNPKIPHAMCFSNFQQNRTNPKKKHAIEKSWKWPPICQRFSLLVISWLPTVFQLEISKSPTVAVHGSFLLKKKSPIPAASIRGVSCRTESDVLTAARLSKRKLTIPHVVSWKKNTDWIFKIWICFQKIHVSIVAFVPFASYVRKTNVCCNSQYTSITLSHSCSSKS